MSDFVRCHFAEMVTDLWELCREQALGREPTFATWARIRGDPVEVEGEAERSPAWRAFYRTRTVLARWGVSFEKEASADDEGSMEDAPIVTDWDALRAFVEREIGPAVETLEDYKRRTGNLRRFRGSGGLARKKPRTEDVPTVQATTGGAAPKGLGDAEPPGPVEVDDARRDDEQYPEREEEEVGHHDDDGEGEDQGDEADAGRAGGDGPLGDVSHSLLREGGPG